VEVASVPTIDGGLVALTKFTPPIGFDPMEFRAIVDLFMQQKQRYRFNYGYHPFHPFSMISCGHVAHMHCGAIYIAGAYEPGYARGMGMKTTATIEEALKDAKRYVGPNPNILALPRTFKTAGVHLMMKE
jgi:hypothetical protein